MLLATVVARLGGLDARLDRIEKRTNVLIGLLGAIIVAMITADGMLWNAIVTSERSLRQDIAQLSDRLDDQITQVERRLDGRITDLERGLVERIHNLELAFVRAGINLRPDNETPPRNQDERRSERNLSPGAGPAQPDAPRPGTPPDQAQ